MVVVVVVVDVVVVVFGQGVVLLSQVKVSSAPSAASHAWPPTVASLINVKTLVWLPIPPHVTEQLPNWPHAPAQSFVGAVTGAKQAQYCFWKAPDCFIQAAYRKELSLYSSK